ncbi:6-phosphogluconolactonase [Fluviicola sp.]|uniref:6-phosphogluconolactonase n=1 Tax=Fluviicola sp. TaxID=1917219 RepID=UPI0031D246BE
MANTLDIHIFDQKSDLIQQVTQSILEDIRHYVNVFGDARILLSGGSTPGPVYKELDTHISNLQVIIGLVDERYVAFESEYSNERLIRECFPQLMNVSGKLKGMVYDLNDEHANIGRVAEEYRIFSERTDIVLLGMGEDGHFASIFPNDPASELALQESNQSIRSTRAPNYPNQRITWDLKSLCQARTAYLVITGEKKLDLLLDSTLNLPIHHLLQANPELKIYHSK